MGLHSRVPPLARIAMRAILVAPADDPADTNAIIGAAGRRPFRVIRVLLTLSRLELRGWITSEWKGRVRVYRPVYAAYWYAPRITEKHAATAAGRADHG